MKIADAFAEGTECSELANKIYQAKVNICEKLGEDEDVDLE